MTGKERINAILNHRDADRIALDFSATKVTGIHCKVMEALRKYYGLDDHPVYILDPGQMLGLMEDDLADALGTDTKGYFENGNTFGTPEDVRKQVRKMCGIFGRDGGFVFNTVHNIQANVPVANVVAMMEELKTIRA